jgi:hypothetical protein
VTAARPGPLEVVEISAHHVDELTGALQQAVVSCRGWTVHFLSPIRCELCVANERDPVDNAGESALGAWQTRNVRTLETALFAHPAEVPTRRGSLKSWVVVCAILNDDNCTGILL